MPLLHCPGEPSFQREWSTIRFADLVRLCLYHVQAAENWRVDKFTRANAVNVRVRVSTQAMWYNMNGTTTSFQLVFDHDSGPALFVFPRGRPTTTSKPCGKSGPRKLQRSRKSNTSLSFVQERYVSSYLLSCGEDVPCRDNHTEGVCVCVCAGSETDDGASAKKDCDAEEGLRQRQRRMTIKQAGSWSQKEIEMDNVVVVADVSLLGRVPTTGDVGSRSSPQLQPLSPAREPLEVES